MTAEDELPGTNLSDNLNNLENLDNLVPQLFVVLRDAQLNLGGGSSEARPPTPPPTPPHPHLGADLERWFRSALAPAERSVLDASIRRTEIFELPPPSEVELRLLDRQLPLAARGGFGGALSALTARLAGELRQLRLPSAAETESARGGGTSGAALAQWLQLAAAQLNQGAEAARDNGHR